MIKLFHYTSINNLALILRNQSIRFGRLDHVNDPTEGIVSDFHSLAPYIFISCWTASNEENLALWNMYTPNMRGVRIELEIPIFQSFKIGDQEDFLFNETEYLNEDKGYFMSGGQNKPLKIEYTDDEALLKPVIRNQNGLHIASVGIHKRTIWSIEQEYRYRIEILPIDKNINKRDFSQRYNHLLDSQTPPPIQDYFIKINNNAFKRMKILCSPKMLNGDIEIIEALKLSYNPTAEINQSILTGFVR